MKLLLRPFTGLALFAGLLSETVFASTFCDLRPGIVPAPFNFNINLGPIYVPRDSPVGSVIGQLDRPFSVNPSENRYVHCEHDGSNTGVVFNSVARRPISTLPVPPVGGENVDGKLYETSIPGIAVRIKLGHPVDGIHPDALTPLSQSNTMPFISVRQTLWATPMQWRTLVGEATLVKIGPIAPGPHNVNDALFDARFQQIGNVFTVSLATTVIQAQCDVSVVSDNPVELGDWSKSDFTGPGYATTPVPFSIALSSCNSDPGDVNIAWANIRLDGVNGSMPIPGVEGGFTLTSDSDAEGVGIQILHRDGFTPIRLGSDVPLMPIASGSTILDLTARFYQTSDAQDVVAGEAKGSLSFTISFL